MLVGTYNSTLKQITKDALNSLKLSDINIDFKIIILESNEKENAYQEFNILQINTLPPLNCAKALNLGIKECRKDTNLIVICNNDLIFETSWATNLLKAFKEHNLDSGCPFDPRYHNLTYKDKITFGYGFRQEVIGWCIAITLNTYSIIENFDEQFDFYYGDNDYIMKLKKYKLKHALVGTSYVQHLLSQSHNILTQEQKNIMASIAKEKFEKKWMLK